MRSRAVRAEPRPHTGKSPGPCCGRIHHAVIILDGSAEVCRLRTSLVIFSLSFALALIVPRFARAAEQGSTGENLEARRAELNRLLSDEWEYTLRTEPELATQVGDNRYNDRLSDFSDKAIADDIAHTDRARARFEAIDVAGFPEQERLNQALMVRSLREIGRAHV